MQKLVIITALSLCCIAKQLPAQTIFNTSDSLTINNIHTGITVHGDLWCDPGVGGYLHQHCEFPAGSRKHLNLIGSLWMSGYDAGGQLHVAAQTYRQNSCDYWPGPLEGDTLTYANSYKWAKIWKTSRTDILLFRMQPSHDVSNTPQAILTWPGRGNVHARGNTGYTLTIPGNMAPFIDLNGNGIYEPLSGEYPDIKGDEAAWWVFSDNGPAHTETNGRPLGVEVHAMVYGYKRNTAIDNVLYYDFELVNRSPNTYNNYRAAIWDDVELGSYMDDYIGFDSSHRMGIAYNAMSPDGYYSGVPDDSYGTNIPIMGLSMIAAPGDAGTAYVPAGSFNSYQNDYTVIGNPAAPGEYDGYMRARIRNGNHITNRFAGAGMPCGALGTGPDCNYLYPGDPSDPMQWSECQCDSLQGDRKFILSSNDHTLPAGGSTRIVFALMALENAGACGTVNFAGIKSLADTAWNIYHHPLAPLPLGVTPVNSGNIAVYPNPAHGQLLIEDRSLSGNDAPTMIIHNIVGQKMSIDPQRTGNRYSIDIAGFPPGVYNVLYSRREVRLSATFMKE